MANQHSFESFLLDKKKNEPSPFDVSKRLDNWLLSLENFYTQIDGWLYPFYQKGLIVTVKKNKHI